MLHRRGSFLVAVLCLASAPATASWVPLGSPEPPLLELRLEPARPEFLYARVAADQDGATGYSGLQARGTWAPPGSDVESGLDPAVRRYRPRDRSRRTRR